MAPQRAALDGIRFVNKLPLNSCARMNPLGCDTLPDIGDIRQHNRAEKMLVHEALT